ncbi:arsenate reductase (glutaredoxin) [Aquimarina sp. MMG015]|uniref:arsenate reductase (glutaredoxin) n=1 Tax=unclassified Aquimarina TaxID=2627091 RepID=UPI000E55508A|nr:MULTISPECIES: arsenate reductase (glutaredoxin) [unclassified Aquimarina]AXT54877.1 arsenate reductase (glutaredoxin) [Aquimarina sp. AD1]MBQ4804710.1 arsenate reductase (glutaredoxin) [Aquimarina sp. MMG015]RKN21527.1 arsenate reductase (glutaredoxin) [Aquimarina sp. AD1]
MTTIYHNPRCSKSRQCLAILEEKKEDLEIIKYLETPITEKKLTEIITLLGIKPIDLVRKNEAIWKQEFKNKDLTDSELIRIMCENPKLIERPIVIKNKKGIIGRPPENVIQIL